jgi:hypothetical protein
MNQIAGLGQTRGFLAKLARENVPEVVVKSRIFPAFTIEDPLGPTPRSFFGELIRPSVTVRTTFGDQVIEPWGPPGSVFPVVAVVAVLGLGALSYFAWKGLRQ